MPHIERDYPTAGGADVMQGAGGWRAEIAGSSQKSARRRKVVVAASRRKTLSQA